MTGSVAAPFRIRKLDWVSKGDDHFAGSAVGEYHVGLVHSAYRCTLFHVWNGGALHSEVAEGGREDVFAAAQRDFEERVRQALEAE